MKVIILSAGQGSRLLPLTKSTPKCALPVAGRTLLEWQLHEISRCAVSEVVVVTGFGADCVDEIADRTKALPVRTVYNPFYSVSDNLGTCWVALREMDEPFVIINGDTLFEAAIFKHLLASPSEAAITLVADRKAVYDADDMKVIIESGRLFRIGKTLCDGVNGESIGMIRFLGEGPQLFSRCVTRMMRHGQGVSRWYLSAIDELARSHRVDVCDIHGLSWCEVDDASDLAHARQVVSSWDLGVDCEPGNVESARISAAAQTNGP